MQRNERRGCRETRDADAEWERRCRGEGGGQGGWGGGSLVVGHDVPQAVGGHDDEVARPQLLLRQVRLLAQVLLDHDVPQRPGHGEHAHDAVAAHEGGDGAARQVDARALSRQVGFVVHRQRHRAAPHARHGAAVARVGHHHVRAAHKAAQRCAAVVPHPRTHGHALLQHLRPKSAQRRLVLGERAVQLVGDFAAVARPCSRLRHGFLQTLPCFGSLCIRPPCHACKIFVGHSVCNPKGRRKI
mmetsp:Transcript_20927/g.57580  ORF Transcript_20927/g.57580 Transcript_20927/m.57580 type:complete len:243 (-) Transcript_20927:502-1230(-)